MPSETQGSVIMLSSEKKENNQPEEKLTVDTLKLTECTSRLFQSMDSKEIARFGNGWIVKCPNCGKLLEIGSDHKTFVAKNKKLLRIAPSIICNKEEGGCGWNAAIVIKPEVNLADVERKEETVEEAIEEETKDGATIE